jgi:hypothetical protein
MGSGATAFGFVTPILFKRPATHSLNKSGEARDDAGQ